jgi:hypothetical protein
MNKAVVQIGALCWLFLLRLIMHGTNVKLLREWFNQGDFEYDHFQQ